MIRSHARLITLVLALLAVLPQSANAAFGDPDNTFGRAGTVVLPEWLWGVPSALKVQSNGKILLALSRPNSDKLIRLHRSGNRDRSFAKKGIYWSPAGTTIAEVEKLRDGRIVVLAVGASGSGTEVARVIMLRRNGRPDHSFARTGTLTIGAGGTGLLARSIAIQNDSKIIAAGSRAGSTTATSLMRVDLTGKIDRTFSNGGTVTVAGAASHLSTKTTSAVAVNNRGEIFLGLDSYAAFPGRGGVAKFTQSGTPVTSFGSGGLAPVQLGQVGGSPIGVSDISIASNGALVVVGEAMYGQKAPSLAGTRNYLNAAGNVIRPPEYQEWTGDVVALSGARFLLNIGTQLEALRGDFSQDASFMRQFWGLTGVCERWGPMDAGTDGTAVAAWTGSSNCIGGKRKLALVRLKTRPTG